MKKLMFGVFSIVLMKVVYDAGLSKSSYYNSYYDGYKEGYRLGKARGKLEEKCKGMFE